MRAMAIGAALGWALAGCCAESRMAPSLARVDAVCAPSAVVVAAPSAAVVAAPPAESVVAAPVRPPPPTAFAPARPAGPTRQRTVSLGNVGDAPLGANASPPGRTPEWTRPFPASWTLTLPRGR